MNLFSVYFRLYWGLAIFVFLSSFLALSWRKVQPAPDVHPINAESDQADGEGAAT